MFAPDPPSLDDYRISFGVLNGTIFVRNVHETGKTPLVFQDADAARRAIAERHSVSLLRFDAMVSGQSGIMF